MRFHLDPVHTYAFSPRPRPHVCVFTKTPSTRMRFQTQLFFVADTAIVHMHTMKTMTENATFRKRSPEWIFLNEKRYRSVFVWTPENKTFR